MAMAKKAKSTGGWILALGILSIIGGLFAIALPLAAGVSVAWVIGIVLLAVGVLQLIGVFQGQSEGQGWADGLGAVIYILGGILSLTHPLAALAAITMLLAIYFGVSGVYQIWAALQVKPAEGWGWIMFGGILSLLLGLMLLLKWPSTALWVPGLFVGIHLIFAGWTKVFLGGRLRGVGKDLEKAGEAVKAKIDEAGRKLGEGLDD